MKKQIYYVIGDSHTLSFQSDIFKIFHIGPATAFKLNSINSTTKSRNKVIYILDNIYKNKKINVIFVFGFVDANLHVNKNIHKNNISKKEAVIQTAVEYFKFLNYIKLRYPLINIYVMNVFPSGEEENIYKVQFYGTRNQRMSIVKQMNRIFKEYSGKNNFNYIDIFNSLIDKDGARIKEYVFDRLSF